MDGLRLNEELYRFRYNQIKTMKNSRITYHKERTRSEFKDIITVKRSIIEKYIILSGSFLMISNAFKQFPDFNLIIPEALSQI
ncbi:MAG: hypothetical protein DRH21_06710 [Deltaproteobacteria bacterium]|nr:MAG: hypothetical protein DRH21_06710 [Deltaproteobacteria bacterium]